MDLVIEANRNSALFNTMQQALDVYNPLLHKARPTIVNQTKHRIPCNPTRWANTLSTWNGAQSVRFDLPRIGSLVDFTLKCAFRIPGTTATAEQRKNTGDRGFAKPSLTLGGSITDNTNATTNNARGRLDRLYADRLLGFNMISNYTVSSKSRRIFSATGEYLLVRFSQMDEDMKKSVMDSITPVDPLSSDIDKTFYAPGTTYTMNIPLFMFFNEHITSALDVNFSEEVHIDIELRPPSELFYYGPLGDLSQVSAKASQLSNQVYLGGSQPVTWDQAIEDAAVAAAVSLTSSATTCLLTTTLAHQAVIGQCVTISGAVETAYNGTFIVTSTPTLFTLTYEAATTPSATTATGSPAWKKSTGFASSALSDGNIATVQDLAMKHIQGLGAPYDKWGAGFLGDCLSSGPTFAYQDVDSNSESVQIQFQANADYIVQDTDAYRALRAQMFPEGTGLTTIVYNTAQERFQTLMDSSIPSQNVLDARSGGTFTDPAYSATGLTLGDSSRYVDMPIRNNNLAFATHFMVRKHSDMGGDGNTIAGNASEVVGTFASGNKLGAHRIYTRCLPVHYFQVLAAGRVVYESDADSHLNLTQSGMYNGTGLEWGKGSSSIENRETGQDRSRSSGRPFNIYSINWGLQASRLENSGSLSFQNLNNPVLRIYFKPDTWSEYSVTATTATGVSDAAKAASLGVQVDILHEYFNVITINSGNGEITSGLNQ